MTPAWQRARLLNPPFAGRECWVKIGKPIEMPAAPILTPAPFQRLEVRPTAGYETNLLDHRGEAVLAKADTTELLARSPEDFLEDVALVAFETWRQDCGTMK